MTKKEMKELYLKHREDIMKAYSVVKNAIGDGLDPEDVTVFVDEIHKMYLVLETFNDKVTLDDKKLFILLIVDELYAEYSKDLPWYIKMIPFKSYFIKKQLSKYIGKILDMLAAKGLIK